MKKKPEPDSDLILYLTEDGRTRLQVRLEGETVWLSLNQMVDLFQRDKSVISRHIKNVFEEGELVRDSVVAESATTAADGKIYQVEFYNLDVIISVGYRVKSRRGTQFRIWATQRLREYIVKGFAMDDDKTQGLFLVFNNGKFETAEPSIVNMGGESRQDVIVPLRKKLWRHVEIVTSAAGNDCTYDVEITGDETVSKTGLEFRNPLTSFGQIKFYSNNGSAGEGDMLIANIKVETAD